MGRYEEREGTHQVAFPDRNDRIHVDLGYRLLP